MVDGVERGDDGQQGLRRADVGGGLLAADVLFAGLEGQPVGGDAGVVPGDTDNPAREGALHAFADGHVRGVRAAEEQGNAESLGGSDGDVRALLTRRGDERQGEEVGGDRHEGAALLRFGDDGGLVPDAAGDAGLLEDDAVDVTAGQSLREVRDLNLEAERFGAAEDNRDGLGEAVGVEDCLAVPGRLVFVGPAHQQHSLGNGGGLIEQGRVGHRKCGEVLDHGLEVQEGFKAALGDFRLVRGVGGVPGGSFKHVPADHRGSHGVVVALADHLHGGLVLAGQRAQRVQYLDLAECAVQLQRPFLADGIGNRAVYQPIEAVIPDGLEHGIDITLAAGADVTVCECGDG